MTICSEVWNQANASACHSSEVAEANQLIVNLLVVIDKCVIFHFFLSYLNILTFLRNNMSLVKNKLYGLAVAQEVQQLSTNQRVRC